MSIFYSCYSNSSTTTCPKVDAYAMIEAENYCSQWGSVVIQNNNIGFIGNGSWIQFDTIDFGVGGNNMEAQVASATAGGDNTTLFCNNTITGNGNDLGGIPAANYKP